MKRTLFVLVLSIFFLGAFAQQKTTSTVNRLIVIDSFRIGNVWIKGVLTNMTLDSTADNQLATVKAIRDWVATHGGGGGGADGNNFPSSFSYDAATRVLTLNRNGISPITQVLPLGNAIAPGLLSVPDKLGIDSAFTKRETALYYGNRFINTYYNHKGEVVWRDTTAKDLNVSLPLFAPNDSTIAAKNDSAAWNAKALRDINIHTTGPADGQVPKYVAAQNRIEWSDDNAGSGSVSDSGVTKAYKYRPGTISTTGNNRFIKIAAGVFRPDVSGGIGSTTTWSFIQNGGHTSIFFDSVVSINNTNSIRVYFPTVKNLLSVVMNPDETLSGYPIDLGATIAVGYAEFLWYRNIIYAGTLTGNGSSWSATSSLEGFSMDYNTSTGLTRFSLPASIQGVDYERFTVTYNGDSTRFIKRQASGIGAYNYGFYLRDLYGNNVTGNLGAGEKVVINSSTIYRQAFVTSPVSAGNQTILSAQSNVWIEGVFEVYLAATPVNATSNYVEWQAYPSATSYKIYRSTNANFSGETLIYSGAGFSHQDTGLTTNTLYYYRMVAVVSGVDTEVTRSEKCRTL